MSAYCLSECEKLDYNNWCKTEERLYQIFCETIINSNLTFKSKKVNIRKYPKVNDREDAFYHITCNDYLKDKKRSPDPRRCERIRWIKSFIENYNNCGACKKCGGIKVWQDSKSKRYHFLLEQERFVVVIEERERFCLLITAFYIEYDNTLKKLLTKYKKSKIES